LKSNQNSIPLAENSPKEKYAVLRINSRLKIKHVALCRIFGQSFCQVDGFYSGTLVTLVIIHSLRSKLIIYNIQKKKQGKNKIRDDEIGVHVNHRKLPATLSNASVLVLV
jgi:hypothetical protein